MLFMCFVGVLVKISHDNCSLPYNEPGGELLLIMIVQVLCPSPPPTDN